MNITTKYGIGDTVWILSGRRAWSRKIVSVYVKATKDGSVISYGLNGQCSRYLETALYRTQKELVEATFPDYEEEKG